MQNKAKGKLTLRHPTFQDVRVKHVGYRRVLKHALLYSIATSVAELTAVTGIYFGLYKMGIVNDTNIYDTFQFVLGLVQIDSLTWSWTWLAYIIPGLFLLNLLAFILGALILVWLFNLASALSGGVVLRFEIMDDPR
jgi:hypothetical protein